MRRGRGLAALTLVAISAVVAMCVYPTEHDADVFVTIDSLTLDTLSRTPTSVGPLVVIQGAEGDVHATAWHRQSGGPSAPVPNVSFRWSVADTTLARIDATTGHLVAIKAGITQVRVVATNFDVGAAPATLDIRVSAPLAIDSIRPDTVRYGEIATVYGVGLLDTIGVLLSIGDATLIPVPFTDTLKANGSSQISFWVPPPAHTAPLSYIAFGAGVFGATPDTVAVIRRDIYEPNEIAPALIDLEARPFPGTVLAPLLFLNPALAFEPLPRDVLQGADWYRLRQLTHGDLPIVLSPTVPGTFQTFLPDQLTFQASDTIYHIGPDSWKVSWSVRNVWNVPGTGELRTMERSRCVSCRRRYQSAPCNTSRGNGSNANPGVRNNRGASTVPGNGLASRAIRAGADSLGPLR